MVNGPQVQDGLPAAVAAHPEEPAAHDDMPTMLAFVLPWAGSAAFLLPDGRRSKISLAIDFGQGGVFRKVQKGR